MTVLKPSTTALLEWENAASILTITSIMAMGSTTITIIITTTTTVITTFKTSSMFVALMVGI